MQRSRHVSARRLVGTVAAFGIVGAGAVALATGGAAAPVEAFTGTCPTTVPAATLVADGVCEVRITTAGAFSFTPPTGITKLAAVLVAAGGGGELNPAQAGSYAGYGGSVVYIDSVALGGPVTGTVGLGGAASQDVSVANAADGGDTTIGADSATGGLGDAVAAICFTATQVYAFGNGAQTAAQGDPDCLPGVGYSFSQLAGVDGALFPAAADGPDVYGNGGAANDTDPGLVSAVAGSGGSVNATLAAPGSDGLVVFRFAPAVPAVAPTLAATGSEVSWMIPAGSAALVAFGALLLALRRRRPAQH
jgi:LPXTG-motif cell wall-anchored protein